jgi:hypothetical protein
VDDDDELSLDDELSEDDELLEMDESVDDHDDDETSDELDADSTDDDVDDDDAHGHMLPSSPKTEYREPSYVMRTNSVATMAPAMNPPPKESECSVSRFQEKEG